MTININSKLGFNNIDMYIVEIIFDFIILIASIFTFKRKRYGLILLVVLFITRMFATVPWSDNAHTAYLLGGKMALFLRDFGLFAIAMCFRKNGISGWISMLASDEYLARSIQKDKDETLSMMHYDNINIDKTKIASIETLDTATIKEDGSINQGNKYPLSLEKKQVNKKEYFKNLTVKAKVALISSIILVLALISCVLVVSTKSYPEYISSFSDKWRYTFNIPNNTLANKLFEDAINSRHKSGFLFINDGKSYYVSSSIYYASRKEIINKNKDSDVYMMKDTVNNKTAIIKNSNYAIKWKNDIWRLVKGTVCLNKYDEWIKENNSFIIVRLEKHNIEHAFKREQDLVEYSTQIPINDINLVKKIANYYELESNYNKSADIYSLALKQDEKNPILLGLLSLSQYYNSEFKLSRECANKALDLDNREIIALQVMSQLEADEFNWSEAKKYAKKAIDYGNENAEPYYVYAQSIYKQGEKEAARDYYNKAYNINENSPLAKKYNECGGCPFDIISMDFAFTKNNGEIITNYGEKLYSSKSQYISSKAKVKVLRGEPCTVQCKLYSRGKLSTGEDSSNGYTYERELFFFTPGRFEENLGGWGNSTPGNWLSGNYRFEVWYNGEKIGEERFTLY